MVLSASHNPMPDNGIKLFARGGHKLPDAVEDEIEARLGESWTRPTGAGVGRARDLPDAAERYAEHLLGTLSHRLDGLRVVVDCAHGAASTVAPLVLARAGAEVIAVAAEPDGLNINDGVGSTHLDGLVAAVLARPAPTPASPTTATPTAAWRSTPPARWSTVTRSSRSARWRCASERPADRADTVVATVMSNLGFHHAMRDAGIQVLTTPVGDRYVLEALHDARAVARRRAERARRLPRPRHHRRRAAHRAAAARPGGGDRRRRWPSWPRSCAGCRRCCSTCRSRTGPGSPPRRPCSTRSRRPRPELGDDGRVLLRPSGTEQIVRVMVEAPTQAVADEVARRVARAVASG